MPLLSRLVLLGCVLAPAALMRLSSALCVFALLAPAAAAQTPQPWEYYPLGIGDVWEYAEPATGNTLRVHVARDTVVNGRDYVVQVRDLLDPLGNPVPPPFPGYPTRFAVRYDTASTHIVYPSFSMPGEERVFTYAPCPFGAESGQSVDCGAFGGTGTVSAFTGTLTVGDTVLTGVRFKEYETVAALVTYAAGIGEAELIAKFDPYRYLVYARVGGVEYGTPRFPVANEPRPPERTGLTVSVWPNPARGPVSLGLALARSSDATLDVYDALGRRVLTSVLGLLPPGEHRRSLDLGALPPGHYLLRLHAATGERATRPVTVAR